MADNSKKYAIIRCAKQHLNDLARVENHNLRLVVSPMENVDPERSDLNRFYIGGGKDTLLQLVQQRIKQAGYTRKIRPDQVMALEFVMTASPQFFDADMRAGNSPKLDAWVNDSMAYIAEHVGKENVVQVVLHMDEETPHLHVVAVPISIDDEAKVSMSSKPWTGAGAWKRMWTAYAKAMKPHGLVRGAFDSNAEHQPLKAGRKEVLDRVANAEATAEHAVTAADQATVAVDAALDRMDMTLAKQTIAIQRQDKKLDTVVEQQRQTITQQAEVIQQQQTLIQSLRDKLNEAYDTIKRLLGRSDTKGPRQPFQPQTSTQQQTVKDLLGGDSFDM